MTGRRSARSSTPTAPAPVSPRVRLQIATCQRKQTYLSRTTAANMAFLLGIAKGRRLQPYRCAVCADWHLTTRRTP